MSALQIPSLRECSGLPMNIFKTFFNLNLSRIRYNKLHLQQNIYSLKNT